MATIDTRIACSALVGVLLLAAGAGAVTPAERCQASKLKTAGKYGFCRLKAESKSVKTGDPANYAKCDEKFSFKWGLAESSAGMGVCPSEGDEAALQAFITQHAGDVAAALAGGPLPDCPADLAACNGDLSTCNGDLSMCNGDLSTCNGSLTTCTSDLTTAQNDLATCNGDLTTCNGNLSTCNSNYAICSADLATVNAGTAVQADVLDLKTFSSSAGIGFTGTMPNNGTIMLTPGTANQTIAAGYHNGAGFCAGDADLVAANISSGVNLFGVAGTALPGQRMKTGQVTCYNAAGTVIACAGTGQDGELQKGLSVSYTDNGDGTVTDNRTGLMWEKLSDDGSIHDKDTTYTWTNAFATKVATLNSGSFAGYTDWRLPNVNELQSLANYGAVGPAVNTAFNTGCVAACTVTTCSCTQSSLYWSSTTYQFTPSGAWGVNFFVGFVNADAKTFSYYVRAVRAGS